MVALDLYLEYLRAAFNTCYYCSVTTDHVEELQRKCIRHVRKPMPKVAACEESKSAETAKTENESSVGDEGKEEDGDKPLENGKDKERERKDTKLVGKDRHNGACFVYFFCVRCCVLNSWL